MLPDSSMMSCVAVLLILATVVAGSTEEYKAYYRHIEESLRLLEATPTTRPPLDQALVTFNDTRGCGTINVLAISTACYHCNLQPLASNKDGSCVVTGVVTAQFDVLLEINGVTTKQSFGNQGEYEVRITNSTPPGIEVITIVKPHSTAVPLILAIVALFVLNFIVRGAWWLWEKRVANNDELERVPLTQPVTVNHVEGQQQDADLPAENEKPNKQLIIRGKVRYVSLDTLRGIALSVMIFVNYGGGAYWFFNHSFWNGLTFADLVFPWFIFIMGTSITIVLTSAAKKGAPKSELAVKALRRGIVLFCFGLFLAAANDSDAIGGRSTSYATLRIPGVLQRFGVSYAVVLLVMYLLPQHEKVQNFDSEQQPPMWKVLMVDVWCYPWQWAVMVTLQVVWLVVTFAIPYPGCPAGYIGPGGIGDYGKHPLCTGGVSTYIDSKLFGLGHIYQGGTEIGTYRTSVRHDPEGGLGFLTSIVLCYFGAVAGRVIVRGSSSGTQQHRQIVSHLAVYGAILCLLAGCLCGFKQNGGPVPVCKNLWSVSFIYVCGGFAFWLLAALYIVVDMKKWWDGAPFTFLGMNSILVYMGSELFPDRFPFSFALPEYTHGWMLFRNLTGVCAWMLFAYYLHKKKWYYAV